MEKEKLPPNDVEEGKTQEVKEGEEKTAAEGGEEEPNKALELVIKLGLCLYALIACVLKLVWCIVQTTLQSKKNYEEGIRKEEKRLASGMGPSGIKW